MENETTQILIEPISEEMIAASQEMSIIADGRQAEWDAIAAAKITASAKLAALGLTEEEVAALIGA